MVKPSVFAKKSVDVKPIEKKAKPITKPVTVQPKKAEKPKVIAEQGIKPSAKL